MPRKTSARTAPAAPSRPLGPFVVRNPRGSPAGHVMVRWHVCHPSMKHERDATKHVGICHEQRWFEGDTFDPPEGFGLARFLQHQSAPGRTCDDEHEGCAGPYLGEVSTDG